MYRSGTQRHNFREERLLRGWLFTQWSRQKRPWRQLVWLSGALPARVAPESSPSARVHVRQSVNHIMNGQKATMALTMYTIPHRQLK